MEISGLTDATTPLWIESNFHTNMAPKIILYMPKESSSPIFVILRFIHMKLVLGIIGYYHYAKLTGSNVDLIFYLLKNGISFLTTLKVPVNLMILRLIIGNL